MSVSALFWQVLNMSITASLVIIFVIAARFLLKKAPKIFSYLLWFVVLFRLLCPVSLPSPLSVLGFLESGKEQPGAITTRIEYVDITRDTPPPSQAPISPAAPDSEEAAGKTASIAQLLPYLWLSGAGAMGLYGLLTGLRFRLHLRSSVPMGKNIYLADHIRSAFVAGLFRPKIYLPSELSQQELAYILAHEKYHLRRGDHLVKHLAYFALCVHWFNPLVWLAFLLCGKDMEMSCDEAVIQKLGPNIRAAYATSLLQLSMEKPILSGSPLAFGECSTKSRIRNLAKWKRPSKGVCLLCLLLCSVIFIACAANPQANSPEAGADTPAVAAPPEAVEATQPPQRFLDFENAAGTVYFQIADGRNVNTENWASVEVIPQALTSGDFERIARVLLGDVPFYEREPTVGAQYSRQQYQDMLDRLEPYANMEAMESLVGTENTMDQVSQLKNALEWTREAMAAAPEENPLTPCDWKLKKERNYNNGQWEYAGRPLSEDQDWLVATAEKDGMGYTYMVAASDRGNNPLSRILFQLGGISAHSHLERQIYWKELCTTEEPTEAQIQAAQEMVLSLLGQMLPGQWQIAKVEVQTDWTGSQRQYRLNIHAVPVLNGIPAVYSQQNLPQNWEESGAYVPTKADFLLSANGDVLDMVLDTPLEIRSISQETALSGAELETQVKKFLSSSGPEVYGLQADRIAEYEKVYEEPLLCEVTISQVECGMVRTMTESSRGSYTYRPTLIFRGHAEYRGKNTGRVYHSSEANGPHVLFCADAMDGSLIY